MLHFTGVASTNEIELRMLSPERIIFLVGDRQAKLDRTTHESMKNINVGISWF